MSLPPPPPPPTPWQPTDPSWQPTFPAAGYPDWPPPRRKQFVWWEALVGLAAPFVATALLYLLAGVAGAFDVLPFLLVGGVIAAGVKRRFTLMAALVIGTVLLVVGLLAWFVIFVLFNPKVL